MKNQKSNFKSAFFYLRVLTALALFCVSASLAFIAFKATSSRSTAEGADNSQSAEEQEPERYMPTGSGKRGNESKDLERQQQFWSDHLTYPTGKFNAAWVRAAAEHHKTMPTGLPAGSFDRLYNPQKLTTRNGMAAPIPSSLSTSQFTSLGPAPLRMTGCNGCYDYTKTQARVNAIAIDPTTTTPGSITAYIGTVAGGVWKTTNCCTTSSTWTLMTDDPLINTTSIDTVTIDPNDHNTIYAGTGDLNFGSFSMGSQGILKSTNGGATWTVLGANVFGANYTEPTGFYSQYQAVGKVRVDPNNSNNVAAGTKKGVYLSHDGGNTWTQCPANSFSTQRQDITGLELSNMGGGVTRIIAAIGTRGFPTYIQYDLGQNGANGIYSATMTNSGCPTFSSIASNANGFVYGPAVTNSPYTAGANMNAGSGVPCNYPYLTAGNATYCGNGVAGGATTNGGTVNNLSRIDIAVAPSNPNVIYAQVGSINWNAGACPSANGCQLGVWATTNGGTSWSFMTGSAGPSLPTNCGQGDYNQNWYDQGIAVDPNNPDRLFIDTYDTWFATRTGTAFNNQTCGYNGTPAANHVVHVDHHALAFLPGDSNTLLEGSDGGIFATTNATAGTASAKATWVNMDGNLNNFEFYAGDISGNFANDPAPVAVGGAQDNCAESVLFSGSPTGPVQWQAGLGGDGFSGQVQTMQSQAQGTITLTTGGAAAGQQFIIGTQTFTFVTSGTATGNVVLNSNTTTEGNNIVTSINRDIPGTATAARSGAVVTVTATAPGAGGNATPFANINSANFVMNGSGFLGGTTQGGQAGNQFWEGNNSGGFSRCIANCTTGGATAVWQSRQGAWTSDTQNFALPVNLFHGGIPGGDDCSPSGASTGCGHLLAATTRVFETITGATPTNSWYITNNPSTQNMTKATLGNRSYINQVKYSPKYMSVAIVGTNDGNVQIGFNLGTGVASQANWVNVTGGNTVLPNRPVQGVTLDPSVSAANLPVGYAALSGFNANSLTATPTPGHIFQVTCTAANCASFTWLDKSGNLPDIPANAVIVNPNYPQQVFLGTDFGLYYTNNITVASPIWYRFESGMPNVMIWDMAIDRGSTTLSVWTRGRGALVYPLPSSDIPQTAPTLLSAVSRMTHGGAGTFNLNLPLDGSGVEPRDGAGNYTIIMTFDKPPVSANMSSSSGSVSNVTYSGNTATVSLTGIPDQQVVTVNANNVTGTNNASQSASLNIGFLIGDVNFDRTVNVGDTILVRNNAGVTLDNTNFKYDVNVDGYVNVGDTIVVRSKSSDFLP